MNRDNFEKRSLETTARINFNLFKGVIGPRFKPCAGRWES